MASPLQHRPSQRLLIVLPSWVGDTVMATPTLRAFRNLYPDAQITVLAKSTVRPVIEGCPWFDRILTVRSKRKGVGAVKRHNPIALARRLKAGRFDTAVLLPNSFRTALLALMAGIPRRVGYDRDGRGFLLTDRLLPRRTTEGKFIPVPTRDYYLGMATYLGSVNPSTSMELFTRPQDDHLANDLLGRGGFDPTQRRPLVLLNPGANYGDAKMWAPERFAAVGDRLQREFDAAVAVTGAPKERPILDRVKSAARSPVIDLPALGADLSLLKSIVKRSSLMVTNDTGPRHLAAALGVPVVTVFGPTNPAWTEIGFAAERQVKFSVFCQPCQKKKCPLKGTKDDHICMKGVEPDMVYEQAAELLRAAAVRV